MTIDWQIELRTYNRFPALTTDEEEHSEDGNSMGDNGAIAVADAPKENRTRAKSRAGTRKTTTCSHSCGKVMLAVAGRIAAMLGLNGGECELQVTAARAIVESHQGASEHEVHESVESRRGENSVRSGGANPELRRHSVPLYL